MAASVGLGAPMTASAGPLQDVWNGIVSFFTGDANATAENDGVTTEVDGDTMTSWQNYKKDTTQNIGRIWTDKTVQNKDVDLGHLDGSQTTTVKKGNSDFLVALSALSSASNTSVMETTPLDIVLVLDVSGSMNSSFGAEYKAVSGMIANGQTENADGYYYVQDSKGAYQKVQWNGGSVNCWSAYDSSTGKQEYVWPSQWNKPSYAKHVQFYVPIQSRLAALKTAVDGFIDATDTANKDIKDTNKKHQISLVQFSTQANTKTAQGLTSDANSLKNTVDGLTATGGTRSDLGVKQAQTVLSGARQDSRKVVIFFTDGMPGPNDTSNKWSDKTANAAIESASAMNANSTLVYSVGVFDGADPSATKVDYEKDANGDPVLEEGNIKTTGPDSDKFNAYMNGISGNYPEAKTFINLGQRVDNTHQYYQAATNAEDLKEVFQNISKEINTSSGSPTQVGSGDPTKGGYITFTDQLGDYMKVDDFKSIVFADTNFTNSQVQQSSDGKTVTYTFSGEAPDKELYPNGNLSDVVIKIEKSGVDDLKTGDKVTVQIPSSLIPLRYFDVDKTAGTMTVKDTYPMRVFFGVSLKDGVKASIDNGSFAKDNAEYVKDHTDANGNVYFLSNHWDGVNAGYPASTGGTLATFQPATTNAYYYFTQDTPIYTDEACENQATGNLDKNATYYYKQVFYTEKDGKAEETTNIASFSGDSAENLNGAVVQKDGKTYFKAGTPKLSYIREFQTNKGNGENVTGTGEAVLNPNWDNPSVSQVNDLTQRLGNNGKLSAPLPATLNVTKNVTVPDSSFNKDDFKDVDFNFTVTSEASKGKTVTVEVKDAQDKPVQGAATSLTFDANTGKANFTLKDGQTISISGLNAGDYTVEETKVPAYFTTKVDNTEGTSKSGTLKANDTVSTTFTNGYKVTTPAVKNDLGGVKVLTGRDWNDTDNYAFKITATGENASKAPMPQKDGKAEDTVLTGTHNGTKDGAEVAFQFGTMTFKTPGAYTYEIHEDSTQSTIGAGVSNSDAHYKVTVTVVNKKDGSLSIQSTEIRQTTDDDNKPLGTNGEGQAVQKITFTNKFDANQNSWSPTGNKAYTDNSGKKPNDGKMFYFRVTPSAGAPKPADVDLESDGSWIANAESSGSITFRNIVFTHSDVGHEYTYTVQEVIKDGEQWKNVSDLMKDGTYVKDGMTYDTRVQTVTVTVSAATEDTGDAAKTVVKVTPTYSNNGQEFAFTNFYTPTPVTLTGESAIHGDKTLSGRDWKKDEKFGFQLTSDDADTTTAIAKQWIVVPGANGASDTTLALPASAEATAADTAHDFDFGSMKFTRPGKYKFQVKETSWNDAALDQVKDKQGLTFDRHTAKVTVTVEDKGGTLAATVTYDNGQGNTDTAKAAFTNTYQASLNYGTNGGLKVSKTLTGRAMKAGEFKFQITGIAGDGTTAEQATAKLTDADKSFSNKSDRASGAADVMTKFQNMAFDQTEAGKTYKFTLTEVEPTDGENDPKLPGVTYDKSAYTIAVKVVDDLDGTMHTVTTISKSDATDIEYNSDDGAPADEKAAAFSNSYEAQPTDGYDTANVGFIKVLSGRDWTDNDTFTFNVTKVSYNGEDTDDAKVTMPDPTTPVEVKKTNADKENGKSFGFGTLTFSKAGTYVYKVIEQNAGQKTDGVTNSSNEATVTIVVKDNTATGKLEVRSATVTNGDKTFTNTYESSINFDDVVDFKLTKTLNGHDMIAGQFKFDVTANASGTEGDSKYVSAEAAAKKIGINNGTTGTVDGAAGADGVTVEMPADSSNTPKLSFKHEDSGKTFSYTFTEQQPVDGEDVTTNDKGQKVEDGYTYDNTSYTMNITPTDNGNGSMSIAVSVTKTVGDDQPQNVELKRGEDSKTVIRLDFVNSYAAIGTLKGSADLKGMKLVKGPWAGNKVGFKFSIKQVADKNGAELGEGDARAALPDPAEATSDKDGNFSFGDITFTKAGDYYFQVVESAGLTPSDGWTNSTEKKIVKVTVAEENAENGNGKLVATKDKSSDALNFTNTYAQTASEAYTPSITKQVTGHDAAAGQFEFTLEAADEATKDAIKDGSIKSDVLKDETTSETKSNTAEIAKDKSEQITFTGMTFTKVSPKDGWYFKVTESHKDDDDPKKDGIQNSGWTMDDHTYGINIKVTDVNAQLVATVTEKGTARFSNNFGATMAYAANGGLNVTKQLNGRKLEANQFDFTISSNDEPSIAKLDKLDAGEKSFKNGDPNDKGISVMQKLGGLAFDEDDINKTFTYTVSEVKKDAMAGYGFDEHLSATVAIAVKEGKNGKIYTVTTVTKGKYSKTYGDKGKTEVAVVPFVNSYEAKTTDADGAVKFEAQKTLTGRAQTAGEFKFAIAPKGAKQNDESDVANGTNTADGKVTFDAINYTSSELDKLAAEKDSYVIKNADGTWTVSYIAYEKTDKLPDGVTVGDKTSFEFTVTVKDDGDGTLSTQVNLPKGDGATTFTNEYGKGGSATAEASATKTLTGRPQKNGEFTFTVAPDVTNAQVIATGKSTAGADGAAADIDFDETTVGVQNVTFKYTFASLKQAVKDGYATYNEDAKTWTVNYVMSEDITKLPHGVTVTNGTESKKNFSVTVKDNGDGTLTATDPAALAFSNTYGSSIPEGSGVALDSQIKKKFEGRTWNESDKFTFEITSVDGGPLPDGVEKSADGKTGTVIVEGNGKDAEQLVKFGSIPFTFDDIKNVVPGSDGKRTKEFTYTVTELVPTGATGNVKDGITYDTHTATITVVLTDNGDGTLTGTTKKSEDGSGQGGVQLMAFVKDVDASVFTNMYESSLDYSAAGGLTINKTLTGRNMADDQFQFTVKQTEGDGDRLGIVGTHASKAADNGVASAVATANADVKFASKDAGKTWRYVISEVVDPAHDGKGYTYDKTTYTVTVSVADNGDSTLTVTTTVAGGKDGDKTYTYITGKTSAEAAVVNFNNTYSADPEYLGGEGDVSLEATKTLTGRDMEADEFGFTVYNGDDEVATGCNDAAGDGKAGKITFSAIKYTSESLYKDAKVGKAAASAPDADGKITYTYNYTVKETKGAVDGVTAVKGEFNVTVRVTDNNDGTLSIKVTPIEGGMAFSNVYGKGEGGKVSMNLRGKKQYNKPADSNAPDIAGKFTFKLTGSEGAPMPEKTEATNDASGNVDFGTIEYTMDNVWPASADDGQAGTEDEGENEGAAGGEAAGGVTTDEAVTDEVTSGEAASREADDGGQPFGESDTGEGVAPAKSESRSKTFEYTVSESGSVPGVTNDATSKTFKVTVTDDGEGNLSVECTDAAGNKIEAGAFKFAFVNTYSTSSVTTDAKTSIRGVKELKVPEGSERALGEGEFSFTLAPATEGAPMPKDATVTNKADGSFTFGEMTFEKSGTYAYTLTEVAGADSSVTYDGSEYTVTVNVVDDSQGSLAIESVAYAKDGKSVDAAKFVNEYKVDGSGATLALGAKKELAGRDLKKGEFEFQLKDESSKVVATAKNDGEGNVSFKDLKFEKVGTFIYTMVEVKGDLDNVEYDDAEYKVTVTVTDKNADGVYDGKLHASATYEGNAMPVFKNTYEPKSVTLAGDTAIKGLKVLEGRELRDAEFSFKIKPISPEGAPMPELDEVYNDSEGRFAFGSMTFTEPGTYVYRVSEVEGSLENVTYDETVYTVTVEVTDDGSGHLVAKVAYDPAADPDNGIVFKNVYAEPTPPGPGPDPDPDPKPDPDPEPEPKPDPEPEPTPDPEPEPEPEPKPDEPEKPETPDEPGKPGNPDAELPQTSDGSLPSAALAGMAAGGAALVAGGTVLIRKRRQR